MNQHDGQKMRLVQAKHYIRSHAKVGDRVELSDGEVVLVGDVNQLGGVCDDCTIGGLVQSACKPDDDCQCEGEEI